MAKSPKYKIYNPDGVYVAACKEAEAAATVVSFYGDGSTIRAGHERGAIVWTEGTDGYATDSYEKTVALIYQRERTWTGI